MQWWWCCCGVQTAPVKLARAVSAGVQENGCIDNKAMLQDWMAGVTAGAGLQSGQMVVFQTEGTIDKHVNADVTVSLESGHVVKFHARPLYEVIAFELLEEANKHSL